MKRKRHAIVLNKLADKSYRQLDAMVKELCIGTPILEGGARWWGRRFAASGKASCRLCT